MPPVVVTGATMTCTFGVAPAVFNADPTGVQAGGLPAGTVMDMAPMVNIPTFGMCNTPSNPVVASATAAALGVLTPMPCIPATASPWQPGALTVKIMGMAVLTQTSMCNCMWGGVITFTNPGQVAVQAT